MLNKTKKDAKNVSSVKKLSSGFERFDSFNSARVSVANLKNNNKQNLTGNKVRYTSLHEKSYPNNNQNNIEPAEFVIPNKKQVQTYPKTQSNINEFSSQEFTKKISMSQDDLDECIIYKNIKEKKDNSKKTKFYGKKNARNRAITNLTNIEIKGNIFVTSGNEAVDDSGNININIRNDSRSNAYHQNNYVDFVNNTK